MFQRPSVPFSPAGAALGDRAAGPGSRTGGQLGKQMVTRVNQRRAQQTHGRRATTADSTWAHRVVLLRGYNTLTDRARARLETFSTDDPTRPPQF